MRPEELLIHPLYGVEFTGGGGRDAHMSRPLGNWQSDNAVDLMCLPGSPVRAIDDGIIDPAAGFGFADDGSTIWGFRFTLSTESDQYFYTHLSSVEKGIRSGSRVAAGQVLGYVGDPARFPSHLHLAVMKGNPDLFLDPKQFEAPVEETH